MDHEPDTFQRLRAEVKRLHDELEKLRAEQDPRRFVGPEVEGEAVKLDELDAEAIRPLLDQWSRGGAALSPSPGGWTKLQPAAVVGLRCEECGEPFLPGEESFAKFPAGHFGNMVVSRVLHGRCLPGRRGRGMARAT